MNVVPAGVSSGLPPKKLLNYKNGIYITQNKFRTE